LNNGLAALGAGNTANNAVVTARQSQDNGVNQMMMNLANALGQTQGLQPKAA
jgi:predicted secreted protein